MATNFTLTVSADKTKSGIQQPVMSAKYIKTVDQAITGTWAEVNFGSVTYPPSTRGLLVHIVNDVALRYTTGTTTPTSELGALIPANTERTLVLEQGLKFYVKTA